MATTKRKKADKEYSYYEYLQKFRHKSAPEEEEQAGEPFDRLNKLALDKIRSGLKADAHPTPRK
jgi:hypothetical protein